MTPEEIEADVEAIDTWIDNYEDVAERKARLCLNRAWEHYGLDSWDALCRERGWNRPLTLEQRQQEVAALRQQGMSTRAIAAAVGADPKTVRNDLAAGGDISPPAPITGTDGKTYQPSRPVEVITAEEFIENYQADIDPDPDNFLPAQSKFERAFWQHLRSGQELVRDLDYPQHFNEQMTRMLLDLIEALHNKRDAIANPGLRVVNGGK
jgi:DNA-binding CsgD family transcriptional regulator